MASDVLATGMMIALCVPCKMSDLDLSTLPPIYAMVTDGYMVRTSPKSLPDGDELLGFELISNSDRWLLISCKTVLLYRDKWLNLTGKGPCVLRVM